MLDQSLFYDVLIILYTLSVLLYFIDFLQHNRKVNQIAFWLLSIVWILQTTLLIQHILNQHTLPLFSRFDTLFFYGWLLITISLVINWLYRMQIVLFFINIIAFTVLSLSLFVAGNEVPAEMAQQLTSEWLIIHITMAYISYAAFTISFTLAVLYLIQHALLKRKTWSTHFRRVPSLIQLEKMSYFLNVIGFPLLLLSLILGVVWAYNTLDSYIWLDTKVVFSLFVLLMYALYLYQRVFQGWAGKKIVELNCICFLVLLINYFISNLFTHFHIWV